MNCSIPRSFPWHTEQVGKGGARRNKYPWESNIYKFSTKEMQSPAPPNALFDDRNHLAAVLISARPTLVTYSCPLLVPPPSNDSSSKTLDMASDWSHFVCVGSTTQALEQSRERPGWVGNRGGWGGWGAAEQPNHRLPDTIPWCPWKETWRSEGCSRPESIRDFQPRCCGVWLSKAC